MTLLDIRTEAADDTDSTATSTATLGVGRDDLHSAFAGIVAGSIGLAPQRRSGYSISDVSVIVDGSTARVRYTTDSPLVEILVTPFQPTLVDGTWVDWVLDDAADFAPGGGTADHFHHSLRPGSQYHYIITARGARGELPTQAVGTFSTERSSLAA